MLSPERNSAKLADCIKWWLHNTDSWTNLLSHARKHVENEYGVYKQAINLGKTYNELLEI